MPPKRPGKASTRKDAKGTDPDRLVRQRAGAYLSADDRFEVQQSATGWFVVDSTTTNEFGQPVMLGPFATLDAARGALPGARKVTPMPRPRKPAAAPHSTKASPKAAAARSAPKPAPRSWIDELPRAEATRVRSLVRQLEREGVAAAENLVRSDRDGLLPAAATRLIEQRLDALVEDLPAIERDRARTLVRRTAEVLTSDGSSVRAPLPRWALVEINPGAEAKNRRIVLRRKR